MLPGANGGPVMPIVEITLAEGRAAGKVRDLIGGVHAAVVDALQVAPEKVRVVVHEVPRTHFAVGGVTKAEAAEAIPTPEAETDDA